MNRTFTISASGMDETWPLKSSVMLAAVSSWIVKNLELNFLTQGRTQKKMAVKITATLVLQQGETRIIDTQPLRNLHTLHHLYQR